MDATGRVALAWDKPGDALPLELDVETDDAADVRAEVWTNVDKNDDPEAYRPIAMKLVGSEGNRARFALDLPVDKIGNYRAAARVSVDGGATWTWMSESGI